MAIDWAATGAMLTGIGTSASALAIGGTAIAALLTYRDWKRQLLYREKHLVAVEILTAGYEAKSIFQNIRSPFMAHQELVEAQKILDSWKGNYPGTADDQRMRILIRTRIGKYEEYWTRLYRLMPRAKALFGEDAKQALFKIIRAQSKTFSAAQMYAELGDGEFKDKMKAMILTDPEPLPDDADDIDRLIETSESTLEEMLIPYVRETSSEGRIVRFLREFQSRTGSTDSQS